MNARLPKPFATVCRQCVPLRPQPPRARARVLFLSMYHLGWKTWTRYLERYTPRCPGLEAVHVRVVQPFWMKLANRPLPRSGGQALLSPARAWRWHVRRRFARRVLTREFDAVFVNSQILAPGLIEPCRRSGTRLMVCTDVTGPAHVRDLLGEPDAGRDWSEERAIFAACSLAVPMSTWIEESLVNDFGVPRGKIAVVPPVIDVAAARRRGGAAPLAVPSGALPRILFCGNDWRRKGGDRLVRWHQEHWADRAELHIVSADADVPPGLRNVVNHGAVPNERLLRDILPAADLFCLPTTRDMSPFAVTEAQAFGLPTVASRIGGMANLVLDGRTGYLVPPQDDAGFVAAVSRLLADVDLLATMGRAATEHARVHLDAAAVLPRLLARVVEAARAP